MFRNFIILPFIILFVIQCFAQNPNGKLNLKVKDGCKQIMFNIDDNKEDSVFYSKNKEYSLKLLYCMPNNCYCVSYFGNLEHPFLIEYNGQASYRRDSTICFFPQAIWVILGK